MLTYKLVFDYLCEQCGILYKQEASMIIGFVTKGLCFFCELDFQDLKFKYIKVK